MSEQTQIVLVDFSSISHPLWHVEGGSIDPNALSVAIVAKIRALTSGQPHAAICCDSRKSFRKDIDATYKAGREAKPAPFFHQCRLALETLVGDGFPIWEFDGFEADDVIASATVAARVGGWPVLIISADKDLLQLVNEHISVKQPMTGTVATPALVQEKFGVAPHQIMDYLTLVGDASDNVGGVKGIGAKGAAALLSVFGNLDDLYAALDKGAAAGIKPAQSAALVAFRERLPVTRKLLALREDVPVPLADVLKDRVPDDVAAFSTEDDEIMKDINEAMPTLAQQDPHTLTTPELIEQHRELTGAEAVEGLGAFVQDVARRVAPKDSNQVAAEAAADKIIHKRAEAAQQPHNQVSVQEAPAPTPSAALVPVVVGPFERQLEPRSMPEAKALSNWIFESRMFGAYGTPQAVMTTVLAGRELGLQAMASLRAIHIVEGKPTLAADFIRSLVLKSGAAHYFRCTERTDTQATFETKRGDDPPQSLTFSVADARRAWSKDQASFDKSGWGKNPADMCVARASAKLARLVYPDVTFGLYAPEEFDND